MKRDLAAGCSAKSLMLRPWNLRERSSNEKKKDPGGLSAVARSPSGSADVDRLRVDGVYLNI